MFWIIQVHLLRNALDFDLWYFDFKQPKLDSTW